jgi:hypothetical protein
MNRRIVADKHLKPVLRATDSQLTAYASRSQTYDPRLIETIALDDWPDNVERVMIAYRLEVNEYQGTKSSPHSAGVSLGVWEQL